MEREKNRRLKIVIISQMNLPIPAVKGGGIETLYTILADANEKYNICDLTIYSIKDTDAMKEAKKYNNTKFVYIHVSIVSRLFFRIVHKIFRDMFMISYYRKIYNILVKEKEDIDALIFGGTVIDGIKEFKEIYGRRMIYHSHVDEKPSRKFIYDNVITISKFCTANWERYIKKDNIKELYNCIKIERFSKRISYEEKRKIRHRLGLGSEDFVVIYCGRIIEIKGVYELIKSIIGIEDDKVKLLMVGSSNFAKGRRTSYVKKIEHLAQRYSERIKFTGYIPNEMLYKYYQIADIQVVPSVCEEAAGLVALEGMASGLPLIVTKSGGMPEYVGTEAAIQIDKDNRLISNLSKSIIFLKENPEKRKEMIDAGGLQVKKYSEDNYYYNFIKIIKEINDSKINNGDRI